MAHDICALQAQIAAKLKTIVDQGDHLRLKADACRAANVSLDEEVKQLGCKKNLLQQQLLNLQAHIYKKGAESQLEAEKACRTKKILESAFSKKKDLIFANTWMKAGLARASLHRIIDLRKDIERLGLALSLKDSLFAEKLKGATKWSLGGSALTKQLEEAETSLVTVSCLEALAQEKNMILPARLTLQDKQVLERLLSDGWKECSLEEKRLLVAFRRCLFHKEVGSKECTSTFDSAAWVKLLQYIEMPQTTVS